MLFRKSKPAEAVKNIVSIHEMDRFVTIKLTDINIAK